VAGFVAGVLMVKIFVREEYVSAHRAHQWQPQRLTRGWGW